MDAYTQETKEWLNDRFSRTDENGIYYAHQPIYGFREEHCEPGCVSRYILTLQIMRALSRVQFNTLLDVGGAEGYKAFLAQQLLGAKVTTSDLSEEACKRAGELFGIPAVPADVHQLPFDNDEFDVILCSESLEHVTDYRKAVSELLRVARKAVVITVPHETEDVSEHHKSEKLLHGHIHSFDQNTFNYLKIDGYEVFSKKILSHLSVIPASLVDAKPRNHRDDWKHPKILTLIYNMSVPIAGKVLNKRAASLLMGIDDFMCKSLPLYKANLYLILKPGYPLLNKETRHISPTDILEIRVPFHYLAGSY
jgi:SAM-dependent methyltransferase